MPCYNPINGWMSRDLNESGKRSVVFNIKEGFSDKPVKVPCGQCIGCRLERSRQWAIRCVHEASFYEDNCFITLTYSDDKLPLNGGLIKYDFQRFMKRLRKAFAPQKIRYFHSGEYGSVNRRPHYHAILFNCDFADKILWQEKLGVRIYRSPLLEKLWTYGFSTIGSVTFESAAYVARYCLKKVTGKNAAEYYKDKEPDYVTMSLKPGIGSAWYDKYMREKFMDGQDWIIINGHKVKPPKYYDRRLEAESDIYDYIKRARKLLAIAHADNNTSERLAVREVVKKAQLKFLRRDL